MTAAVGVISSSSVQVVDSPEAAAATPEVTAALTDTDKEGTAAAYDAGDEMEPDFGVTEVVSAGVVFAALAAVAKDDGSTAVIDKLLDKVVDSVQLVECSIEELWPYVVLYTVAFHAVDFGANDAMV